MRTPGHDVELAAGFLYTESVVDGLDDFAAIVGASATINTVDCVLSVGSLYAAALERAARGPIVSSRAVCGETQIEDVLRRIRN